MKTFRTGERIPTHLLKQAMKLQRGRSWTQIFVLMWREKARVKEIQGVRLCHIQNVDFCPKGSLNCLNPATNSWVLCGIVSWGPGPECVHPGHIFRQMYLYLYLYLCTPRPAVHIFRQTQGLALLTHIVKLLVTKISVMFTLEKFHLVAKFLSNAASGSTWWKNF